MPPTTFAEDTGGGGAPPAPVAPPRTPQIDTGPAQRRITDLETQRTQLISRSATAGVLQKPQIEADIRNIETQLSSAYRELGTSVRAQAQIDSRNSMTAGGPQALAAYTRAQADLARADAYETRANAYAETTGAKRSQLEAAARDADAQANLRQAQADLAVATKPDEIARAHIAVDQAQATVDATRSNTANATATTTANVGETKARTEQITQLTPAMVESYVARGILDRATADKINAEGPATIKDLLARGALSTAQADRLNALLPGEIAQQGANLEKDKLGSLYGLPDRIAAMQKLIAAGTVTPEQASTQLQDYITSQIGTATTGATPFQRNQDALAQETARRGQDSSLAGTKSSVMGGAFSSGLSTFAKLNDTVQPGSDAAGLGFIASQRMMADQLNNYQPSTPVDSPLLKSMQTPAAPAPPVTPAGVQAGTQAPAADTGHTITINIGGTGGTLAPGVTGTAGDPTVGPTAPPVNPQAAGDPYANSSSTQMPTFLQNGPATQDHVAQAWANDPNLHPEMQAAA